MGADQRFLASIDREEAMAALLVDFPELEIRSFHPTEQGWDNATFLLNDEFIVRFPRSHEVQTLPECWLLGAMTGLSPVPIPKIEFTGTATTYSAYRYLPGIRFATVHKSWSRLERERELDRLIEFFAVMHASVNVEAAKANGIVADRRDLAFLIASVDRSGKEFEVARRALPAFHIDMPIVVLHNDLHSENILVDPKSREITGVIDFGDAACGKPVLDLNYLLEYDLAAAEWIVERYRHYGGIDIDAQHLRDVYFLLTLNDYLDPDVPAGDKDFMRGLVDGYLASL